jgi:hypothetical protein
MISTLRAYGGSTSQTAARILVLLDKLGQTPTPAELATMTGAVKVIRAMSRLAKLDFWLRNPDYLADELLTDIENGILAPADALPHVARMLEGEAPVLHLYPMKRYKYGAWELPDNALALLRSYRFIDHHRVAEVDADNAGKARRDYFLLEAGQKALGDMRDDVKQLSWYDAQADAIKLLAVAASGASARKRQYEQPEYAETPIGHDIAPILPRTRQRFERIATLYRNALPVTGVKCGEEAM